MKVKRFHTLVKSFVGKGYLRSRFRQTMDNVIKQLEQYPGIVALEDADTNKIMTRKQFLKQYKVK